MGSRGTRGGREGSELYFTAKNLTSTSLHFPLLFIPPPQGLSAVLTSLPDNLLRGPQQCCPRLRRHMHLIHIDAARGLHEGSGTEGNVWARGSGTAGGFFSVFDHNRVMEASCQRAINSLCVNGKVLELRASCNSGYLGHAAQVLGYLLTDVHSCFVGLTRARVMPAWRFGFRQVLELLERVDLAAAAAAKAAAAKTAAAKACIGEMDSGAAISPWGILEVLQRLMYEVCVFKICCCYGSDFEFLKYFEI